jgi:plasmid stabilization system protein ParE
MALKIIWTEEAQISRRSIFNYWNKRNKSKTYSNKLNVQFNEAIKQVSYLNEIGKPSDFIGVRSKFVSHFELIYKVSTDVLIIVDIWDTRQNPDDFPIK